MDPELAKEIRNLIDTFPPYPDINMLIGNSDLKKVRGGYEVLTEAGMHAINRYVIGVTLSNKGKPAVFKLAKRRKFE